MTVTGMKEVPKSIHHSGHVWQAAGFLATMMKVTEGGGGVLGVILLGDKKIKAQGRLLALPLRIVRHTGCGT